VPAVAGVSFQIAPGDFYTLLGPSGCGKTTTLRCVAGLEAPDGGVISVAGRTMSGEGQFVPPHKRDIGMVFQSYAIWPHMTVFENVAFPLRVGKGISQAEVKRRVEEALVTVQMESYASRFATQLSGGQQQRLALARALIRRPKLLLLDEPLSNLDAKLRERMRAEVRELQRALGITTLYVTHDQAEALSMSSRISVMERGRIIQEGTPLDIYQHPATRFVADFVGSSNFLPATVRGSDGELTTFDTTAGPLRAHRAEGVAAGDRVTFTIRPENLWLHPIPPSGVPNVLPGVIDHQLFLGDAFECKVRVGEAMLVARQHPTGVVRGGDTVYVEFPVALCTVLIESHAVDAATRTADASEHPMSLSSTA
jgi:iron(III) transport system ATP-binding protein